jgi:hypothetical protein
MSLKQACQKALVSHNVPAKLACECANIIVKDDAGKPKLGRSPEDQYRIDASSIWMEVNNETRSR